MGSQPLARGQPLVVGHLFSGGQPIWLQHQQARGKATPTSCYILITTGLYPGHPYPGVANPLWGQPNLADIPLQGTLPYQSVNPTIQTQQAHQAHHITWGDHQVNFSMQEVHLFNHSIWVDNLGNHHTWEDHLVFPSRRNLYMVFLVFLCHMITTSIHRIINNFQYWL
jgi:hypothetical protein